LLLAPSTPPAFPDSPVGPAPKSFPRLLAWLILPALLVLLALVVGGKTLLSRSSGSDPEPASEAPAVTEDPATNEEAPPPDEDQEVAEPLPTSIPVEVPETTDLSVVEIPVGLPSEEEEPTDTTEPETPELVDTVEPEPPASASAGMGCCVDGVFQTDMGGDECARLEGTPMLPSEAPTRCEQLGENAEGWCCIDQEVFPSSAAYCERNGGRFGRTERRARRRCATQEERHR
ncbi:MAG TPA: hypothetical protein VJ885_09110, partial [Thermoanaerobaculia bacterium]|nr:hypothetical protein [Thermoanaerobaculia bacterium]